MVPGLSPQIGASLGMPERCLLPVSLGETHEERSYSLLLNRRTEINVISISEMQIVQERKMVYCCFYVLFWVLVGFFPPNLKKKIQVENSTLISRIESP